MKKSYFGLLAAGFALSSTSAHAGTNKQNKPMENMVYMEVEVGEFFGLFLKDSAEVKIKMATKNAYGFEGMPRTADEKMEMERIDTYLQNNIADMIGLKNLTCTYEVDKIEKQFDKQIGNMTGVIKAEYDVKCNDNIKNHDMQLNFSAFKNITQMLVKVEAIKTTRYDLNGNQGTVNLK